jgi:hypothetical protein
VEYCKEFRNISKALETSADIEEYVYAPPSISSMQTQTDYLIALQTSDIIAITFSIAAFGATVIGNIIAYQSMKALQSKGMALCDISIKYIDKSQALTISSFLQINHLCCLSIVFSHGLITLIRAVMKV